MLVRQVEANNWQEAGSEQSDGPMPRYRVRARWKKNKTES